MDTFLILSFPTQAQADTCLTAINQLAATYWQKQGYTVIDGQLIGKNAATGEDMPESARTITWDTVKEAPNGEFYFASLSNDERFAKGMEQLPDAFFGYTEKPMPAEWMLENG